MLFFVHATFTNLKPGTSNEASLLSSSSSSTHSTMSSVAHSEQGTHGIDSEVKKILNCCSNSPATSNRATNRTLKQVPTLVSSAKLKADVKFWQDCDEEECI